MKCSAGTCTGTLSVSPDMWVSCDECSHMFIMPKQMQSMIEDIGYESDKPKGKIKSYTAEVKIFEHYKRMRDFNGFIKGY